MSLVSDTVANLINGVSQQPANLRLASQCELQENMYSSVVDALGRRPPTQHRAKISSSDYTSALMHTINRDAVERYEVVIVDDDLFVYDLDGNAKVVNFPDGKGYLNSSDPKTKMKALTVADYTFIVNQEITVAMESALSTTRQKEALVYVKQGNYGRTYKVFIDGVQKADYTVPDGSSAAHTANIDTKYIADNLATDLVASLGAGWTVTRFDSVIAIQKTTGDFSIALEDGFGGLAMIAIKDKVQKFSDLPPRSIENFTVLVAGEPEAGEDDYYVKYEVQNNTGSNYTGVWTETIKPGIKYQLDAATMPHVLIRESNGEFTFQEATWLDRLVGDEDTIPEPSFVGKTMTDVYFFKNRLGFIADENAIMSRSGEFFGFFRQTATQLLDSDPIDIAASHTKVSILKHAVPFNEELTFFSEQTQFPLRSGDLLTPKDVALPPNTEFECSAMCKPVGIGKNIYFASKKAPWSAIHEYFTDNSIESGKDATDITANTPRYIPNNVFKLAPAPNEQVMVALSADAPNELYIYKFFFQNETKLQSSWSKWTFPETDTLLNVDFLDTTLHLVVQRDDGCYIDKIAIESGASDLGSNFITYLDRRVDESQCNISYDAGTNLTTVELPYETDEVDASWRIATRAGNTVGGYNEGYVLAHTFISPTEFTLVGDHTDTLFYFGRRFASRWKPGPLLIRKALATGGAIAQLQGRLQISNITLNYDRTGYFEVRVTPLGRDTSTYKMTGRIVGSINNPIGEVALETGAFKSPVGSRNTTVDIEVYNDTHLPTFLTSLEWVGRYWVRERKI